MVTCVGLGVVEWCVVFGFPNPNTWTKQALDEARGKIAQMQNRARHALNEGRIPLIQRFEGEEIDKAELFGMWTKIFENVP